MSSPIVLESLKALSKAGGDATLKRVSRVGHLDRNSLARTLRVCEEIGLVTKVSKGRSEIFRPTVLAQEYLSILTEDYQNLADRVANIAEKLGSSPYNLLEMERDVQRSIADLGRISPDVKSAVETITTHLGEVGVHVVQMNLEQQSALEELRELSFVFQLASRQFSPGSAEQKVTKEVSRLLDIAYGGVAYSEKSETRLALPTASTILILKAASDTLETASGIVKYAKDLGLEKVEFERTGEDGRGRPIYRVK